MKNPSAKKRSIAGTYLPRHLRASAEQLLQREQPIESWEALFQEMHPGGIAHGGVDRGMRDFMRVVASHYPHLDAGQIGELLERFKVGSGLAENAALTQEQGGQIIRWIVKQNEGAYPSSREAAADTAESVVERQLGGGWPGEVPRRLLDWLLERIEKEDRYSVRWYAAVRTLLRSPEAEEGDLIRFLDSLTSAVQLNASDLLWKVVRHERAGPEIWRRVAELCPRSAPHAKREAWLGLMTHTAAREQPEVRSAFFQRAGEEECVALLKHLPHDEEERQRVWRGICPSHGLSVAIRIAEKAGMNLAWLEGEGEEMWRPLGSVIDTGALRYLASQLRGERYRETVRRFLLVRPLEALDFLASTPLSEGQRLEAADLSSLLAHPDAEVRLKSIALVGRTAGERPEGASPLPVATPLLVGRKAG